MANSKLVYTDSGGIQEETTILGIPRAGHWGQIFILDKTESVKASVRHWVNYKKCNKGGQATFNNTKFFRKEISGIIQHWLLFIQKN
jgi:UDP-N-acetylglucosamine 2-epimerase